MFFVWTAILLGAGLPGTVFGFLLLDEKEDNTLKAMLVTPLPPRFYIAYRVALPTLIGILMTVVVVLIAGLAVPPWWQLVLLAAGASLFAPISAIFYAVYAENRVQGFALAKFPGILSMVLTISWFVRDPLQLLFGLLPPYWIAKAYWLVLEGNPMWVGALLLGIVLQAAVILYLAHRFSQVAYE
jgi:fluoroquinolone transport system permease protein